MLVRATSGGLVIQGSDVILGFGANFLRFYDNTTGIPRPTITGSRGGNAALASLLTALGLTGLGLITDSSTP